MATAFTTAIEARDKRWSTAEGRADWLDPDPDIRALLLKAHGARSRLPCRPVLAVSRRTRAGGRSDRRQRHRSRGHARDRASPRRIIASAIRNGRCTGFELLFLKQQQHRKPGSWHWHIIAARRPQETI